MARAAPGGGSAEELDHLDLMTEEPLSAGGEQPRVEGRSPFRLAMERFRRDKVAMASVVFILVLALFALAAPLIAISSGVLAPMSRPIGAWIPLSASTDIPSSSSASKMRLTLALTQRWPCSAQ